MRLATLLLASGLSVPQLPARSFPEERLPPYVTPLTDFGQRADWSLDGRRILFVSRAGGEVWELELATRTLRSISARLEVPEGWGFYRALYLPNGDYLFTCGPARSQAYLMIVDSALQRSKIFHDLVIAEGPAVSRRALRIAFTRRQEKIWVADLVYRREEPFVENERLIIDNRNVVVDGVRYEGMLEPQNFRPPDDSELIWSQYGEDDRGVFTAEVMGYRFSDGRLTNYSRAPRQYDEPEGIFPDGRYTLVECDRHEPLGTGYIDVYRLRLDGMGRDLVRLTSFADVPGFRASNPVVSDDGRWIVFQESRRDSPPGAGDGLYLLDLEKLYRLRPELRPKEDPSPLQFRGSALGASRGG